jgi:hypothetical protein
MITTMIVQSTSVRGEHDDASWVLLTCPRYLYRAFTSHLPGTDTCCVSWRSPVPYAALLPMTHFLPRNSRRSKAQHGAECSGSHRSAVGLTSRIAHPGWMRTCRLLPRMMTRTHPQQPSEEKFESFIVDWILLTIRLPNETYQVVLPSYARI